MERLGNYAVVALDHEAKASRLSRLGALAKPANYDRGGVPVAYDPVIDLLPSRLIVWRGNDGKVEITRPLMAEERAAIDARCAAIELALEPHNENDRAGIEAALGAMFSGFRQLRQVGEDVGAMVTITRAVLHRSPAWAIKRACIMIASGEARLDRRFPPSDAQIADVVDGILRPLIKAMRDGREILKAGVRQEPPLGGYRSAPSKSRDPMPEIDEMTNERRAALVADLEARKRRNEGRANG